MSLIGIWTLKSCKATASKGQIVYPYGEKPVGHLVYTSNKKVIVTLMSSARKNFQSKDLTQASTDEKAAAFDSFDSYSGNFSVDNQHGTVIHHIEAGRIPNWVGKSHIRHFSISGDTLTLLTEPFVMSDEEWKAEVIWERLN